MARVSINATRIAKALGAASEKIRPAVHEALAKTGAHLERQIKLAYGAAGLKVRTGRLRSSIGFAFRAPLALLVGIIRNPGGKELAYAWQKEKGGTIYGRPWLAIPLPAVLTAAGVARGFARDYRDHPGQFGFTGTFVHKGVIFGHLAGGAKGKGIGGGKSSVVPLFVLKHSVTQRAHPFVIPTVQRELPIAQEKFFVPAIRKAAFGTAA